MANPEMGPQEPEEEISQEKEQTPEEILAIINEAIEKGREVSLTQLKSDRKSSITNIAIPYSIEGNFLTIEAGGYGFDIEVNSIKRAELVGERENQEE